MMYKDLFAYGFLLVIASQRACMHLVKFSLPSYRIAGIFRGYKLSRIGCYRQVFADLIFAAI